MKRIMFSTGVILSIIILTATTASSQKYKTAADSVKLNEKYVQVSNEIAELTSKLTIAQNNLPGFHEKATTATADAHTTAMESSNQASKATNGDLNDAKMARKKAGKALDGAEDAKSANGDVKNQDKKIAKLNSQLFKKKAELLELETMRTTIRGRQ